MQRSCMGESYRSSTPVRAAFVGLVISTLCGASALAQQTASSQPSSGVEDVFALDTIVVTAQKRPQPAQDVPISMTVLGAEALAETRAGSLDELQQLVPSFSMESQSGFDVLTIRGVGGGGRNIGFDPRVGVYLDGVYMGQAQALRQPLFDVEQVEVLRGPQGHLFGRNTVAGAVNMTTRAPSREFEGFAGGGIGSRGAQEGYVSVAGPMADKVLGKIVVNAESRDGFTANLYDGQRLDDLRRTSVRGQLVLLPSDHLKISIAADTSSNRQKWVIGEAESGLFGLPLAGGVLPRRTVNFNTTPREAADLSGGSITASYTLDSGHVLTAIAGYRDTHHEKQTDNDWGPQDLLWTFYVDDFRQHSGEVRLTSPQSGHTRYVAGVYLLEETARTDRKATVGQDAATALVQFPGVAGLLPFGPALGLSPSAVIRNDGEVRTDTHALYGALDQDIATMLTLNMGARYTHETKRVLFNLDGSASGALAIGSLSGYRDSREENKLSPSIGVTYAMSREQNLYAKYAQGFKSGGWNTEFLSSNGVKHPAFNSETVRCVEAGAKGRLLDGRLRYDLAAYTSRYKDFQVFQFVDLGGGATSIELRNAAEAESHGLDASLALKASPQLDIGLSLGWASATFRRFDNCSALADCTGHRLPYAPLMTAALTLHYTQPLPSLGGKLDVYGELSHHGKSFSDPVNDPATQAIPSRELVNLHLGYRPDHSRVEFSLWAHNLFDRDTVAMRVRDFLGNLTSRRMDPRQVWLGAKFDL